MNRRLYSLIVVPLVLLFAAAAIMTAGAGKPPPSGGGLAVAPIFSDNAVLQRNMPVPVFGTATSGTLVTVSFQGQNLSTTAGADGKWRVNLAAMPASTSPSTLTVTGGGTSKVFSNVQVGEVWVYSGQSNMHFALSSSVGGADAVATAGNYNIRLYSTGAYGSAGWQISNSSTAGSFSAVAFYMGRQLAINLPGVPIGLISQPVSGSLIITWTHCLGGSRDGRNYDAQIKPLQPYAIRGVCWYQGEDDAHFGPEGYYTKLSGLIDEWRADWGQGAFPFYIVQLHWNGTAEGWPLIREDQLQAYLQKTNIGLATAVDLPPGGGHPPTKEPVGVRLALWARALIYGETSLVYSGPIRSGATVSGNKVTVSFNFTGGGLTTNNGLAPGPFKIAGADGVYRDATATIIGNTVEVTSSVTVPKHIRYIWNYAQGNLCNTNGLPAVPFQLDL